MNALMWICCFLLNCNNGLKLRNNTDTVITAKLSVVQNDCTDNLPNLPIKALNTVTADVEAFFSS